MPVLDSGPGGEEAVELLATPEDLAARLGRELTDAEIDRAEALLADASAAVRIYTGQEFTRRETTVLLMPRNGKIRLPQRPVVGVSAVADVDDNALGFTWYTGDLLSVTLDGWQIEGVYSGPVAVTYEHGYDAIPGAIVAVVCQIAGRALGRPADQTGYTGESVGDYSYTVGGAAAAGAVGMLADEKAVLDRYRRRGAVARMDA